MALPTLSKTWQFDVNNVIASAAELTFYQNLAYELKEAMTGFASNPWTVIASCDSTTANNSGTDLWLAPANIVWNTGAHSWIVLENASGSQLCIAMDFTGTNNQDALIFFSPGGEFLVANGGTDGTTTARPTAPDEYDARTGPDLSAWWGNQTTTPAQNVFHMWHSTDGTLTYIVGYSGNIPHTFVALGSINNPVTGHVEPYLGTWLTNTGVINIITTTNLSDSQRLSSAQAGTEMTLFVTGMGHANQLSHEVAAASVAEELSGELFFTECGLFSGITGMRGPKGSLHDIYWGQYQVASDGDTYPNNAATRQWVQMGHLVLPWLGDGTVPLTS